MGYIGIRTTGSIYGYRFERREFSNRVRRRDDIREAARGLAEYIDQTESLTRSTSNPSKHGNGFSRNRPGLS